MLMSWGVNMWIRLSKVELFWNYIGTVMELMDRKQMIR